MTNLKRLRSAMEGSGVSALLVSEIENVRWLTGFTGTSGFAIVTAADGRFVTDSRYAIRAREEVRELSSHIFASPIESADFLADQARDMGLSSLGFEAAYTTFATVESWRDKFAPVELVPVADILGELRMIKSPEEIESIRQACKVADLAFDHAARLIRPGVTELDIALEIEFFFRRQGLDLAFPVAVVSGERTAMPHGRPSEKKLEPGDFVTMDFGAKVDGYCSDITRTVVVGHLPDRQREIYHAVLGAQTLALEAMRPGMEARAVDAVARDRLEREGLAKYFGHGLGHGLGRVVHDGGRLNPTSSTIIEPGQVWTVEPGVYIEGFGGVRIEDDVVVTEDGIEILTQSPKELLVLPR